MQPSKPCGGRFGGASFSWVLPGKPFDQASTRAGDIRPAYLLCGHYEGVDYRVEEDLADETISVGDYILTGGELPAMTVTDAVARMIPGVLGAASGAADDSFTRRSSNARSIRSRPSFAAWLCRKSCETAITPRLKMAPPVVLSRTLDLRRPSRTLRVVTERCGNTEQTKGRQAMKNLLICRIGSLSHTIRTLTSLRRPLPTTTCMIFRGRPRRVLWHKNISSSTHVPGQLDMVRKIMGFWESDTGRNYNGYRTQAFDIVDIRPFHRSVSMP